LKYKTFFLHCKAFEGTRHPAWNRDGYERFAVNPAGKAFQVVKGEVIDIRTFLAFSLPVLFLQPEKNLDNPTFSNPGGFF